MTHTNFAIATLFNGICQGTILAAVMWVVLKMLPRLNSATRFMVLWMTLIAVFALPIWLMLLKAPITTGTQPDSHPLATTNAPAATTVAPVKSRYTELKPGANLESDPALIPEIEP